MKRQLLAVAFLTLAGPALAQAQMPGMSGMPGMMRGTQGQDMPGMTQGPTGSSPAQTQQMPMAQMPGMSGMMRGGQSGTMMCGPMMGAMSGMGGRGAGAMSDTAMRPSGDESVPSLALRAVNDKMHRAMAIEMTGNADADFAKTMIAHHQGAIDMAKIALAFGKDPDIRRLAESVVRAQEAEIATLREWLAKQPR